MFFVCIYCKAATLPPPSSGVTFMGPHYYHIATTKFPCVPLLGPQSDLHRRGPDRPGGEVSDWFFFPSRVSDPPPCPVYSPVGKKKYGPNGGCPLDEGMRGKIPFWRSYGGTKSAVRTGGVHWKRGAEGLCHPLTNVESTNNFFFD